MQMDHNRNREQDLHREAAVTSFTFFRSRVNSSVSAVDGSEPLSKWRFDQIYLAHVAVTDIGKHIHHYTGQTFRDALEIAGVFQESDPTRFQPGNADPGKHPCDLLGRRRPRNRNPHGKTGDRAGRRGFMLWDEWVNNIKRSDWLPSTHDSSLTTVIILAFYVNYNPNYQKRELTKLYVKIKCCYGAIKQIV